MYMVASFFTPVWSIVHMVFHYMSFITEPKSDCAKESCNRYSSNSKGNAIFLQTLGDRAELSFLYN